jgi:hypothetical protein
MFHLITDNIEAYRRAVACTEVAHAEWSYDCKDTSAEELRNCREEEQVRLEGLMAVIKMLIQDAAAQEPHNPFSINGDVNQPPVHPRSRLEQAAAEDPQVRTLSPKWSKVLSPPPPREDTNE